MKRIRFHYYFLSIVSLISLICIGFSSWSLVQDVLSTGATGTLSASPIYSVDDYLTFDGEMECFEFNEDGFVANSEQAESGSITVYYKLNVAQCKADFGTNATINLSFYLRGVSVSGTALTFTNQSPLAFSTATGSGITIGSSSATGNYVCANSAISLSTLNADLAFSVTYTFTNGTANFSNLYSLLINSNSEMANFYAHARIEKA